jgi:hypothetical protein
VVLNRQTYLVLPLAFDSVSRICANALKCVNLMGQRFVRHWLQRLVRATVPPNSVSCRPVSLFLSSPRELRVCLARRRARLGKRRLA